MDSVEQEKLFELRRQARADKAQLDARILELHYQVVQLLHQGSEQSDWVRAEAFKQTDLWEDRRLCNPRYVHEWRRLLELPVDQAQVEILREDDYGISMRQNSPFTAALILVKQRNDGQGHAGD